MDEILRFLKSKPPYNPKQSREDFIKNKTIVPGEPPIPNRRNYKHRLPKFEKPTIFDENALEQLKLDPDQYVTFFRSLLYAEEHKSTEELKLYDRQRTPMSKVEDRLVLKVPGLAEKRPSVLDGDHVLVVKCGESEKGKAYQGFVHKTHKKSVVLKFGKSFLQKVYSPNAKFDVRFTLNRISMRRMHQALNNPEMDINRLFPQDHKNNENQNINIEFDPYTDHLNSYQKRAVAIIKLGIHHPSPFIVFGPPGTG
jgi:helicase MOV-10